MKIAVAVLIVLFAGVQSSILDDAQREKLRVIRGQCVAQSGFLPFEIGVLARAIGPARKLQRASQCIVEQLQAQQGQDADVDAIIARTKQVIGQAVLPKLVNQAISNCERLVGEESCDKLINAVGAIIQERRRSRNLQIGQE